MHDIPGVTFTTGTGAGGVANRFTEGWCPVRILPPVHTNDNYYHTTANSVMQHSPEARTPDAMKGVRTNLWPFPPMRGLDRPIPAAPPLGTKFEWGPHAEPHTRPACLAGMPRQTATDNMRYIHGRQSHDMQHNKITYNNTTKCLPFS